MSRNKRSNWVHINSHQAQNLAYRTLKFTLHWHVHQLSLATEVLRL